MSSAALERAREAYRRQEWKAARDGYRAVGDESLAGDDLYALSTSLWWLGEMEESMSVTEEVHRRYLTDDRPAEAAIAAIDLAINHFLRGDQVLGSGWISRASRLLESQAESAAHGYLAYVVEVEANWRTARAEEVIGAARRVRQIGIDHGDANLVAVALNGEGRVLLEQGEVADGLRLLDEALASVLAGEVEPEWVGNIYCNTIAACHELGDIERLVRWTDATEKWLETLPAAVLFAGICRVHRAQILRIRGDWDAAEREASRVCRELAGISERNVGEAWYQLGELRRLRGDVGGAEEAYRSAHRHGRDPQPGLALLRLMMGRAKAAWASVASALLAATDRLERAPILAAGVEIGVAAGEMEEAQELGEELSDIAAAYASSGLRAMAVTAEGSVTLAAGRPEEALTLLREAHRRWRELEAPYEAARACVGLVGAYRALGDEEAAERERTSAVDTFTQLGALPDAAALLDRSGSAARAGGLTDREIEVLTLVAAGRTNREIGASLFISQKTVARHLSNIFSKLGVATRTEAARFAFDNHLV